MSEREQEIRKEMSFSKNNLNQNYKLVKNQGYRMITMGEFLAFLGLLNGMVGGTILVLPLLGLQTGYLLIPCVTLLIGLIAFYTCHLIVLHLGECHNIREVILQHFNNRFEALVIYNLIIAISIVGALINYFQLIVIQIEGFIQPSQWIGISVFLILLVLTVVMRYFNFGEKLLAIGIFSIIAYLGFLTWAQATAEHSPKKVPPTGPKFTDLASSLVMGYSIHDFVVQVLFKTTTNDKFQKVVKMVYAAGILVYTYICYGCYAIANRQPRNDDPQTISEYFAVGGWQVRTIQIIYLFHLLTASPEFCLIMRARILQMFKIEETQHITIPQFSIYLGMYLLSYVMYSCKIKLQVVIEINGSIIGFLYVSLIPIVVHLKCVYFTKHDDKGELVCEEKQPDGTVVVIENTCKCKIEYKSKFTQGLQLAWQAVIMVVGIYTIYHTLKLMFWGTESETHAPQL